MTRVLILAGFTEESITYNAGEVVDFTSLGIIQARKAAGQVNDSSAAVQAALAGGALRRHHDYEYAQRKPALSAREILAARGILPSRTMSDAQLVTLLAKTTTAMTRFDVEMLARDVIFTAPPIVVVPTPTPTPNPTPTPTPAPTPTPSGPAVTALPDNVYLPEAQALFTAMDAVGTTPLTRQRKWQINETILRMQLGGIWSHCSWVNEAYFAQNDAQLAINWKDPSKSLTKVGAPTFTPGTPLATGAAGGQVPVQAAGNRWVTDVPLSAIDPKSFFMGYFSTTVASVASVACGAQTSGGLGLQIIPSNTAGVMQARAMGPAQATTSNATNWNGGGWHSINYNEAEMATIRYGHNGAIVDAAVPTTAPAAINDPALIAAFGGGTGSASTPAFGGRMFVLATGLSVAQEELLGAIVRDQYAARRYGEPTFISPGTSAVVMDYGCYGLTLESIFAAIRFKIQEPTASVIMIGAELETTPQALGGNPGAGNLGWADVYSGLTLGGMWKEAVNWGNATYYNGRAAPPWTNTTPSTGTPSLQTNTSFEGTMWNAHCRMLLAKYGIPVYFTGGAISVQRATSADGRILSMTTADGRTFTTTTYGQILGAENMGLFPELANFPRVRGQEAAGTGAEAFNGYLTPKSVGTAYEDPGLPSIGNTYYRISPYVVENNAGSGLLPYVIADPAIVQGAAYPDGQQAICVRMPEVDSNGRYRRAPPISGTIGANVPAPPGYAQLNYENRGRLCAANPNADISDFLKRSVVSSPVTDTNNAGATGFSTDMPQSGTRLANALNPAARKAVLQEVIQYQQGFLYYMGYSGDARIPAALSAAFRGYTFDAQQYTNPEPGFPLWWPFPYIRSTKWRLKNDNIVWNGNHLALGDGSALPAAFKGRVAGLASYFGADYHQGSLMAFDDGSGSGPALYAQGNIHDNTNPGGADKIAPIPFDILAPDKATCPNFMTPTYGSMTSYNYSFARMDAVKCAMGEVCGVTAAIAWRKGIAVQDVDNAEMIAAVQAGTWATPLPFRTIN